MGTFFIYFTGDVLSTIQRTVVVHAYVLEDDTRLPGLLLPLEGQGYVRPADVPALSGVSDTCIRTRIEGKKPANPVKSCHVTWKETSQPTKPNYQPFIQPFFFFLPVVPIPGALPVPQQHQPVRPLPGRRRRGGRIPVAASSCCCCRCRGVETCVWYRCVCEWSRRSIDPMTVTHKIEIAWLTV